MPKRKFVLAEQSSSLRFIDIPEDWHGPAVEHAGERFAPGVGHPILPERDINHLVVDFLLDLVPDSTSV